MVRQLMRCAHNAPAHASHCHCQVLVIGAGLTTASFMSVLSNSKKQQWKTAVYSTLQSPQTQALAPLNRVYVDYMLAQDSLIYMAAAHPQGQGSAANDDSHTTPAGNRALFDHLIVKFRERRDMPWCSNSAINTGMFGRMTGPPCMNAMQMQPT